MQKRYARRMEHLSGSAIRAIFKLLANPEIISFAGGMPAGDLFPYEDIRRITSEVLAGPEAQEALQYGVTPGVAEYRESAAQFLTSHGLKTEAKNVLTLTGSQQGIDLVSKVMLDPGDVVLCEAPTFLGAMQIFRSYEAEVIGVPMDEDGVLIDVLEDNMIKHQPKFFYVIPNFQNPSGRTLSAERRAAISELAAKYNVLILEDDPYGYLRYAGQALPSIKSFDKSESVVLLQSFSKLVSPGLRVGAAIADDAMLTKLEVAKQGTDTHSPNLSQMIVDRFMRQGLLEPHIKSMCGVYRERMQCMLDCLGSEFPQSVKYTHPEGGLFLWAELPEGINTLELLQSALKRNVAFIPGEHFYADGTGQNTLRLNFSASSIERIQKGMKILGEVIKEAL